MGEVEFALAVAVDLSGEAVVLQVVAGASVQEGEPVELLGGEVEVLDGLDGTGGTGDNAVAALIGQSAGEDLEGAPAVGGAVGQGGLQHRQFVHVGEQGGGGRAGAAAGGGGGCGHTVT